MFLHWVLFQGLGNYLLWWELKWAGVGRGIRNVYEGVGLYGSWGSWRIWQLEWKLVRCFWVLHAYTYVMSQHIADNLTGMLRSCNDWFHLSPDMAPKWQTWAQHVSWPPSHQVCLRHGKLSEVVSRLILKLREVVPLAWETIYSLGEVMRVTSTGLPDLGLKSVTEV